MGSIQSDPGSPRRGESRRHASLPTEQQSGQVAEQAGDSKRVFRKAGVSPVMDIHLALQEDRREVGRDKLRIRQGGILGQAKRLTFECAKTLRHASLRKFLLQSRRKHQSQPLIESDQAAIKCSVMQP